MKTTIDLDIDDTAIRAAAQKQAEHLISGLLTPAGWQGKGGQIWETLNRQVAAAMAARLATDDHAAALRQLVADKIAAAVDEIASKVAAATVRKAAK